MKAVYLPRAKAPIDVPHTVREGIVMIDVAAALHGIYGPDLWADNSRFVEDDIDTQNRRFAKWCKRRRLHYYARPREDFFEFEAIEEAKKLGFKGVVLEDLS